MLEGMVRSRRWCRGVIVGCKREMGLSVQGQGEGCRDEYNERD